MKLLYQERSFNDRNVILWLCQECFLTNGNECLTKFFACSIGVVFADHEIVDKYNRHT